MKKEQALTSYQTGQRNIDDTKTIKSGIIMEPKLTLNNQGHYELTEYNLTDQKQITIEFLGTADSEQLSQDIRQTLKNEYLRKIFKETKK